MAIKLPAYERQVRAAPLQAPQAQVVNASTAPGLEALGRGIERLGAGLGHYETRQEHEAAKADALRVDVAKEQLAEKKRQLLESPDSGFLVKSLGLNAVLNSDSVKNDFDKYTKELAKGLSPSQREALEAVALHESSTLGHVIDQHVVEQTGKLREKTSQAILIGKANDAASSAVRGDMQGVLDSIGAGQGQIESDSAHAGDGPDLTNAKLHAYTSGARIGVLETLMGANQPDKAAQLLAEWGPTLDQDKLNDSNLRERVDKANVRQQSENYASGAWGFSKNNVAEAERLLGDTAIADPRVRELAVIGVRKHAADFDKAQAKADDETLARLSQTVSKGRGTFTIQDLEHDPDFLELRKQDGRAAAYRMRDAAERHRRSGGDGGNKDGREALQDYRALVATDPDEALNVNPNERYAGVPKLWMDRILEQKGKLGTAEGKAQAIRLGEFNQLVSSKLKGMKKERVAENSGLMLDWYVQYETEHGKPPPRAEALKTLADELANGEVEEWGRNPARTRAESRARGEEFIPAKDAPTAPQPAPPAQGAPSGDTVRVRLSDGRTGRVPRNMIPAGAEVIK